MNIVSALVVSISKQVVSKPFSPRAKAIMQQYKGRTSGVMWLFRDMLHSTKSNFSYVY